MSTFETKGQEPYAVKSVLKENSAVNPDTGKGIYVRYTELVASDDVPETLKNVIAECNRRAEEAAEKRLQSVHSQLTADDLEKKSWPYVFAGYAYIVTVTRADRVAFSILETEHEMGNWQYWGGVSSYQFRGKTFDTVSGREFALGELIADERALSKKLEKALETQYQTSGLAGTGPSDYSWTADVLGIRFYFNSDAVSKETRREIGDYSDNAITVAIPYNIMGGAAVEKLSIVPEDYIAQIDHETMYNLPHGDFSIMLTKNDDNVIIRIMPDKEQESSLIIEYANFEKNDFYIIRNQGCFYLFRERLDYQEGFFYDFSDRDGGYGRFRYYTSQFFESFLKEIRLALPYNPHCVLMREENRLSGKDTYFTPYSHYVFTKERGYKRFVPIDGILQIDTHNKALRLLDDIFAVEIDDEGKELQEITLKGGSAIFFESATGEADRYRIPPERRYQYDNFIYNYRLADGRRVRISEKNEKSLTRFLEGVSLAEARFDIKPPEPEVFTVNIGGKDYPVIPDFSKGDHIGEEIDFGDDIWWQAEGYVGLYEVTEEDISEVRGNYVMGKVPSEAHNTLLVIGKDGRVRFEYYGTVYEGRLPDKRYYGKEATISLKSKLGGRSFVIWLRGGSLHNPPTKIRFYSMGVPATNMPSTVPSIDAYLTKTSTEIPEQYDFPDEAAEENNPGDEVTCPCGKTWGKNVRFCLECGAPLKKS